MEDLVDSLSVEGGYDGSMVYVRLSLDVSKDVLDLIDDLILTPFERIAEVDLLSKIFNAGDDESRRFGETVTVEGDFSAGAHLTVLVGFEIAGTDLANITGFSAADIASRAFIQFEDVSAKFTASAQVSGSLDIAGVSTLTLDEGSVALGFGIGIEEASPRIYFPNISSTLLTLRQEAQWRRVGAVDISLPISFTINDDTLSLNPIITISDDNLFDTQAATVAIDFDIR